MFHGSIGFVAQGKEFHMQSTISPELRSSEICMVAKVCICLTLQNLINTQNMFSVCLQGSNNSFKSFYFLPCNCGVGHPKDKHFLTKFITRGTFRRQDFKTLEIAPLNWETQRFKVVQE